MVVRNVPFFMIVFISSIKRMRASLYFDQDISKFRHDGGATRIPLFMEGTGGGVHVSDEFTSDVESNEDNEDV